MACTYWKMTIQHGGILTAIFGDVDSMRQIEQLWWQWLEHPETQKDTDILSAMGMCDSIDRASVELTVLMHEITSMCLTEWT